MFLPRTLHHDPSSGLRPEANASLRVSHYPHCMARQPQLPPGKLQATYQRPPQPPAILPIRQAPVRAVTFFCSSVFSAFGGPSPDETPETPLSDLHSALE